MNLYRFKQTKYLAVFVLLSFFMSFSVTLVTPDATANDEGAADTGSQEFTIAETDENNLVDQVEEMQETIPEPLMVEWTWQMTSDPALGNPILVIEWSEGEPLTTFSSASDHITGPDADIWTFTVSHVGIPVGATVQYEIIEETSSVPPVEEINSSNEPPAAEEPVVEESSEPGEGTADEGITDEETTSEGTNGDETTGEGTTGEGTTDEGAADEGTSGEAGFFSFSGSGGTPGESLIDGLVLLSASPSSSSNSVVKGLNQTGRITLTKSWYENNVEVTGDSATFALTGSYEYISGYTTKQNGTFKNWVYTTQLVSVTSSANETNKTITFDIALPEYDAAALPAGETLPADTVRFGNQDALSLSETATAGDFIGVGFNDTDEQSLAILVNDIWDNPTRTPKVSYTCTYKNSKYDGKVNLKEAHVGASSETFQNEADDGGLTDPVVWHFVLGHVDGAPGGTIYVKFQGSTGYVSANVAKINNQMQHFYVGSSRPAILEDAYVQFPDGSTWRPDPANPPFLNLSHVSLNDVDGGHIIVNKYLDGTPAAGFDFIMDGKTYTTGADGTVTIDVTPAPKGTTYTVEESTTTGLMATNLYYTYDNLTKTVEVEPGESEDMSFYNYSRTGTITVTKEYINTTGQEIPGDLECMISLAGPTPGQQVVYPGGEAFFYNLKPGNYTITETISPPGFTPQIASQEIVIGPGADETWDADIDWYNEEQIGRLAITKNVISTETGTPSLDGFEFEVYDPYDNLVGSGESDSTGTVMFGTNDYLEVRAGLVYTIKEVNLPPGYFSAYAEGLPSPKIVANETTTVTVDNVQGESGQIILFKYYEGAEPTPVKFTLYKEDRNNIPIASGICDSNGDYITFNGDGSGDYWIVEEYLDPELYPGQQVVKSEIGARWTNNLSTAPFYWDNEESQVINVTNTRKTGTVRVWKTYEDEYPFNTGYDPVGIDIPAIGIENDILYPYIVKDYIVPVGVPITITENDMPDFETSYEYSYSGPDTDLEPGNTVTLSAGEDYPWAWVHITNTRIYPSLTITKEFINPENLDLGHVVALIEITAEADYPARAEGQSLISEISNSYSGMFIVWIALHDGESYTLDEWIYGEEYSIREIGLFDDRQLTYNPAAPLVDPFAELPDELYAGEYTGVIAPATFDDDGNMSRLVTNTFEDEGDGGKDDPKKPRNPDETGNDEPGETVSVAPEVTTIAPQPQVIAPQPTSVPVVVEQTPPAQLPATGAEGMASIMLLASMFAGSGAVLRRVGRK